MTSISHGSPPNIKVGIEASITYAISCHEGVQSRLHDIFSLLKIKDNYREIPSEKNNDGVNKRIYKRNIPFHFHYKNRAYYYSYGGNKRSGGNGNFFLFFVGSLVVAKEYIIQRQNLTRLVWDRIKINNRKEEIRDMEEKIKLCKYSIKQGFHEFGYDYPQLCMKKVEIAEQAIKLRVKSPVYLYLKIAGIALAALGLVGLFFKNNFAILFIPALLCFIPVLFSFIHDYHQKKIYAEKLNCLAEEMNKKKEALQNNELKEALEKKRGCFDE
jgi:hypothetical protein